MSATDPVVNEFNGPILEIRRALPLMPCPWCGSADVKLFEYPDTGLGAETYVQCQDCTVCGPDHLKGRHWNDVPRMLTNLRADAEYFKHNRDIVGQELQAMRQWQAHVMTDQLPEIARFISGSRALISTSRTFYEVRDKLSNAVLLLERNAQEIAWLRSALAQIIDIEHESSPAAVTASENIALKALGKPCFCGNDGQPGPGHQMNCQRYREDDVAVAMSEIGML
jgi:hypothetical protein